MSHTHSPLLTTPSGPFQCSDDKFSFDLFRTWLAVHCSSGDLWTKYIPQVATVYPALQHALVALGTIVLPLRRKDFWNYEASRLKSLALTNKAINELTRHKHTPVIVVVLVAWMLWQLERAQGHFEHISGPRNLHLESGLKVAAALDPHDADQAAVLQLMQGWKSIGTFYDFFARQYPALASAHTPIMLRKAGAVEMCRRTLEEVIVAQLKIAFDEPNNNEDDHIVNSPHQPTNNNDNTTSTLSTAEKAILLKSLRRLRNELNWFLDRWSASVAHVNADSVLVGVPSTLASPYLENISTGTYSVERLCAEFGRVLMIFLGRIIQDDVPLRADLMDFMEVMWR
jgi:hypothetical protein